MTATTSKGRNRRTDGRTDNRRERGMALLTVIILGLVFTTLGLTLYALASREWAQVRHRDDSASAFWLADAAIEHAKGKLFNDITWDSGFVAPQALGEGTYTLALTDSTYGGQPALHMYARGFVPKPSGGYTERDVEVFASVYPAAFEYAIHCMNEIHTSGNVGACGRVHGNDLVDDAGSSLDPPHGCTTGKAITEGFVVIPPVIRTEPQYYPNTTYYWVVGKPAGPFTDALILKADPAGAFTIRTGHTATQVGTIATNNYTGAGTPIQYSFNNAADATTMFDWSTGICKRDSAAGHSAVVVNFGEYLQGAASKVSNLHFKADYAIRSTVMNTRLKVYPPPDSSATALTDSMAWTGGNFTCQQAAFTPANGIALVLHTINDPGNSNITIGTPTSPAVFYITGSIMKFNANGNMYGTTVVLGNITDMKGNPDFWFNNGYRPNLPPYLNGFWWNGTSGIADILLWREPSPLYS
jgi:hypothetical protein